MYSIQTMIERELYAQIKPYINKPEAIVITGMRRTGKTSLLQYILQKIESTNKLYIDLENPLNQQMFEEVDYERIIDSLAFKGLNIKQPAYVFLDEIQFVKSIPSVVKYLSDHYQIKFFLTSSASFYLKNVFTESLSGRKYVFELFPCSFKEFLLFKNIATPELKHKKITSTLHAQYDRLYTEYIHYGGFPGVILKETSEEKKKMLENIFSSYYQLEINQLSDFRKTNVIRDLILLLMERAGSKVDVQKLSTELGVSRITINEYLYFLEQTYFIKLIRPFSRSKDTEIRSTTKVYLCDTGIINHFAKVNEGNLFEDTVFNQLRLLGEVNYYARKNGLEIDFILEKKHAYEVKIFPDSKDLKRLENLAQELKCKDWQIIAKRYSKLANTQYGFML